MSTDVSEVRAASIIRAIQKILSFIIAAVRT
jgi:hypothetical protein